MNLTIALTHNCQLRCDYCYAGEKHHKAISKETIAQAIAFTFEIPMQKLEFGLFGGEPLMEWELLVGNPPRRSRSQKTSRKTHQNRHHQRGTAQ